jgi:hypothetical protein
MYVRIALSVTDTDEDFIEEVSRFKFTKESPTPLKINIGTKIGHCIM